MISSLIDMEVKPVKRNVELPSNVYTIHDYAISFIKGMSDENKKRFKRMLDGGIKCGESVAESYGVKYEDFINEVKKELV